MNFLSHSAVRLLTLSVLPATLLAACSGKPSQLPDRQSNERVTRGQQLLAHYQCGSCHSIPGVPASRGTTGPTLEAFGLRSYIAGQVPNGPDALARWLVNPQALVPSTTMPSMGASPEDARNMAAYLLSLQ